METLRIMVQAIAVVGFFLIVSQPVNAASSCSVTSGDESETCSISCPEGESARCTKTESSVDCSCEEG